MLRIFTDPYSGLQGNTWRPFLFVVEAQLNINYLCSL